MRERVVDWLWRYGPAECAGLAVAFAASLIVRRFTGSAIAAAYAAAWGETLGYATLIAVRDLLSETHDTRRDGGDVTPRHVGNVVVALLAEFGPAGVMDTLVTRPLAMAAGVRLFGPILGLIAGKLAADVVFYIPVIYMYERRKRSAAARTTSRSSEP